MCQLSECRGTERGGARTAQDSSPGTPSSARCLLHGSIAVKETEGGSALNIWKNNWGFIISIRNFLNSKFFLAPGKNILC